MKRLFLCLGLCLPVLSFAQNAQKFSITGKAANLSAPAKAYLVYYLGANSVTDSSAIDKGSFSFTGTVTSPVNASLFIDYKGTGFTKFIQQNFPGGKTSATADGINFFIEKGNISITTPDSLLGQW